MKVQYRRETGPILPRRNLDPAPYSNMVPDPEDN